MSLTCEDEISRDAEEPQETGPSVLENRLGPDEALEPPRAFANGSSHGNTSPEVRKNAP